MPDDWAKSQGRHFSSLMANKKLNLHQRHLVDFAKRFDAQKTGNLEGVSGRSKKLC